MNAIVRMFVRASRWQLYLLYAIGYVLFTAATIAFGVLVGPAPKNSWKLLLVVWVCGLPLVLGQVGWMWSAGVFLKSLLSRRCECVRAFSISVWRWQFCAHWDGPFSFSTAMIRSLYA
jgi:hypothetical protein